MKILCLFKCHEVAKFETTKSVDGKWVSAPGERYRLGAVKRTDEDKHPESPFFAGATPSGTLEFSTANEAVFGTFEVGKIYSLTLEVADPETPLY